MVFGLLLFTEKSSLVYGDLTLFIGIAMYSVYLNVVAIEPEPATQNLMMSTVKVACGPDPQSLALQAIQDVFKGARKGI